MSKVHIIDDKEPTLEELQKLVGGYIEVKYLDFDRKFTGPDKGMQLVMNEEALIYQLPLNTKAMDYIQKLLDNHIKTAGYKLLPIYGDVVILKGKGKLT